MTRTCYGLMYFFLMSLLIVSQHTDYFKQFFKNLLRGLGTKRPFQPPIPSQVEQKALVCPFLEGFQNCIRMSILSYVSCLLSCGGNLIKILLGCVGNYIAMQIFKRKVKMGSIFYPSVSGILFCNILHTNRAWSFTLSRKLIFVISSCNGLSHTSL